MFLVLKRFPPFVIAVFVPVNQIEFLTSAIHFRISCGPNFICGNFGSDPHSFQVFYPLLSPVQMPRCCNCCSTQWESRELGNICSTISSIFCPNEQKNSQFSHIKSLSTLEFMFTISSCMPTERTSAVTSIVIWEKCGFWHMLSNPYRVVVLLTASYWLSSASFIMIW